MDETRAETDVLRQETGVQKQKLDRRIEDLRKQQARLKQLEKATAAALAIQKAAYAKLIRNKKDLARAIATTKAAQKALAAKIDDLVEQQFAAGNIPSKYNGTLRWPLTGSITGEFGCSSYPGYGPGQGCAHFHNGIDIVAPSGCDPDQGRRRRPTSGTSAGTTPTGRIRPGSSSSSTPRTCRRGTPT